MNKDKPSIAIHGGAWAIPQDLWLGSVTGVKEAALKGFKMLLEGGSAVDAAEEAVVYLENNPTFNAGTGSVLTYDEEVEMDAMIMDGRNLNSGAVASLKNVLNPIRVARMVMSETPHLLIVGDGANAFASRNGVATISPDLIVTEGAKEKLRKFKKFNTTIDSLFTYTREKGESHDTVGCVALDSEGHLASATSTGGITAKLPGRVGDSPIVGAGGMADDDVGAVSTTGHGEAIMKTCLSKTILCNLSAGLSATSAAKMALNYMEKRAGGYGGAVVISRQGDVAAQFSTEKMAWSYIKNNELHFGLHPGEDLMEIISPENL